ncbi:hypothetical protein C0583_01105 [Candidatus Parcubacteria bacterium]|nr:MAG: hypothetical protein C0583_01105 [Candidatus Parcubacteria bacterium]
MWVKDYMFCDVHTIGPEATVAEAVKKMVDEKTNSLIVVDENKKPVGVLSSYTLIRKVVPAYLKDDPVYSNFGAEGTFDKYANLLKDKKIKEVLNGETHILSVDDAMIEAASHSTNAKKRILPVVDADGKLIGAITRTCIKNALYNAIYKDKQINPENGGCCCKGKKE